jgi:hypothetical protein
MQSAGQNPVATTWLPRPAFTVSKTINPESREAATAQQIRGFGSAEDAGFEPARVLTQHDFQFCYAAFALVRQSHFIRDVTPPADHWCTAANVGE